MLKGRSKSFAPKSVPRAPKRKGQDDAPEPANRISMTPDRPAEPTPTPEITRVEKRRAEDVIEEPPAKRVSIVEEPSIRTSETARLEKRKPQDDIGAPAQRVSTQSDSSTIRTTQNVRMETTDADPDQSSSTQAVVEPTVRSTTLAGATPPNSNVRERDGGDESRAEGAGNVKATANEVEPHASAVTESHLAGQITPQTANNTESGVPSQESRPVVIVAPEHETAASSETRNDEAAPAPNCLTATNAIQDSVLPSIERSDTPAINHNNSVPSQSPTPIPRTPVESNDFRYPSPENMARLVDSEPIGTPANMGPPGGQLGAAGDTTAVNRAGEIVQMATLNPDGTTGGIVVNEPASGTGKGKKKKRVVKKKKTQGEETRAVINMGLEDASRNDNGRVVKKKPRAKSNRKRKEREETPPDAEEQEIDINTMTMTDLCADLRIGKKFSRHDELRERIIKQKQEAVRQKMRTDDEETRARLDREEQEDEARFAQNRAAAAANPNPTTEEANGEANGEAAEQDDSDDAGNAAPQMTVVDGQIVLDEASLRLNLRQEGARARAKMEMVELVEDDFSKVFTSSFKQKRTNPGSWDPISTEEFYKCLSQFGTDFETISKVFPGRSRRQIKLKFNNEEKKNPAKITRYLTNPKAAMMDIDEFERKSGIKLESVEDIKAQHDEAAAKEQAELDAKQEEFRAGELAKKAKIMETSAKRQSQKDATSSILASIELGSDDEDDAPRRSAGESSKENAAPTTGKGKRKAAPKKPRKNKHSHVAGGDEVIILGEV